MEMNSTKLPNCLNISPRITSPGILINHNHTSPVTEFLSYSLPLFELQLGIILMMAHGLSFLLGRFGISMFISQIFVGIILGPNILGRFNFMKEVVFPIDGSGLLTEVAVFAFRVHIFLTAVDINLESAKRLTGKFAITTGLATVLVPLAVALAMLAPLIGYYKKRNLFLEAYTMILLQSVTTFSVVVHVLKDLKIPNSEIGHLLLSSAMIFGGISSQTFVASSIYFGSSQLMDACAYIGYVIVIAFLIRPGMNWIIEKTPVGSPVDSSITCGLIMIALISEAYFQTFGQSPGLGAYTFGMLVPAGPPLGSALLEKFETFSYGVLLPVAVVTTTMKADFIMMFTHYGEIRIYVLFVIAILVVKLLSCLVPMLFCEIPFADSVLFATIVINRGPIEMSLVLSASLKKILSEPAYSLLIFMILVTSVVVSMVVKCLYDPTKSYVSYHERNVTSLKPDSPLRILACVHDQDNIYSLTRFLDAFRPTRERSLVLHVLHLVPLTGLNTPMIVSHNKQNPIIEEDTPSHNVIIHFNQYEQMNPEGTTVSTYTSISLVSSMNEDISILAFDHVASIIVLPFHRKWTIHGRIEAEDINIRTINRKVLEKAPCSVAIFLDRGKLGRRRLESCPLETPVSICVIFLGDKDDWEALAMATKAAADMSSQLTVIHFMLKNETKDVEATWNNENDEMNGEEDINKKVLEKRLKIYQQNETFLGNIEYLPKYVKDGAETATEIRSVTDKYDLFVVGRRYGIESRKTSGLTEWIEIPELGIVGDFLASKDANTRADVLVVQQQKKFRS